MASPLTFNQAPISANLCCMITGILPSAAGPIFKSKFPHEKRCLLIDERVVSLINNLPDFRFGCIQKSHLFPVFFPGRLFMIAFLDFLLHGHTQKSENCRARCGYHFPTVIDHNTVFTGDSLNNQAKNSSLLQVLADWSHSPSVQRTSGL